ncbi:hypothetical protein Mal4_43330 [Maioricimonas rarisocia]|uniref:Uncharacterized protein n=1 Tax=Maioricimonas rarisocia TaxID=2528026 RepID=A0A517ZC03_9PLAN|nr:hypothetical protein [Maioricimonas rarisocia]QDU39979.1 hypothetical protein Mal4_43330 [Maioricimonas rarisocia]
MHTLLPSCRPTTTLPRRGAALIIAVICLLFAGALSLSVVRLVVTQQRQLEREEWATQAALLAEGGIARAIQQLNNSDAYEGETWQPEVPGEGAQPARVELSVEHLDLEPLGPRIRIEAVADYPDAANHRARVRRSVVIPVTDGTDALSTSL